MLRDGVLYFSTEKGKPPHGKIHLNGLVVVGSAEESTDKKYTFKVGVPGEMYYLEAKSDAEKNDWLQEIGKALTVNEQKSEFDFDDDGWP